ncbi:DNA-binding protein [Azotobacter chroococcum]|uniref:helix-turn-helix domain-containing protein n=1 Tax=Azotobacter chroococcum TaxID=353 RepID=UPI00103AADBC|nr:helix-turn-helix domain-containing protein [Azotobacter chroococcum]TBW04265.1 DNA-binding protein [Azotobacter chroococcum]
MLHTITEAIALTGKSRRTIYNHCDQGRLSYSIGPDGRRYFDTAELIRVYGPLHAVAHRESPESAQVCTPEIAHPDGPLTEATALRLIAAIERLVEIEEKKLLLLEHKPGSRPELNAPTTSNQGSEPEAGQNKRKKAENFADLLSVLDGN